jgi:DNA topoisomerase-1
MPKNLVIVESPAKAKTIARFLGKDYAIKSSYGHIRDLPKSEFGVDIKKHFSPTYEISGEKQKVVSELKAAARGSTVWLATDEDREGEAIAWHICTALGLKPSGARRIVFHEITEPAITAAVKSPREIDMKLVDAQQARRILDRLVGYELSPILWKKIRTGLSAGRVQSVAVRLVVEREREIRDFQPQSSFKVTALFTSSKHQLPAELVDKLTSPKTARVFLEAANKATYEVLDVEEKPGTRAPSAPFTTSTLQQEAARRLGFSVRQTMSLAQRLYEHGHITYMRTDSTNLSSLAVNAIKAYIVKNYGLKYSSPKQYTTKAKGAQQAHEAIRPAHINISSAGADSAQKKLYQLIWRRAVASQMAPAAVQKTEIRIGMSNQPKQFLASGEILNFDGFLKVYGGGKEDTILPKVEKGQKLDLKTMSALEIFSRPAARYSEAGLVKKLEELGIGRPSTYSPTISTVQDRGYVEKRDLEGEARKVKELVLQGGRVVEKDQEIVVGADRGKLVPTDLAEVVTDFLLKYFTSIVDYEFTANAEEQLDDIAEGKLTWQKMLDKFYRHFHPMIKHSQTVSRAEVTQMRELGRDPKSGKPVYARFGRFGPVLQLGDSVDKKAEASEKPKFASLPEGAALENVTIEQALPMFKLPRLVGKTSDGQEIIADIGRFGPYIKVDNQFTSIKDEDPLSITETDARKILAAKKTLEKQRVVADYGEIKVLRGRYGPYVTDGKKNVSLPKDLNPKKVTEKKAQKLLTS